MLYIYINSYVLGIYIISLFTNEETEAKRTFLAKVTQLVLEFRLGQSNSRESLLSQRTENRHATSQTPLQLVVA